MSDWWKKERVTSTVNELKVMIPEMLFLEALFKYNRKLWVRSFPFHFGLYLLVGFLGMLFVGSLFYIGGSETPAFILLVQSGMPLGAGSLHCAVGPSRALKQKYAVSLLRFCR